MIIHYQKISTSEIFVRRIEFEEISNILPFPFVLITSPYKNWTGNKFNWGRIIHVYIYPINSFHLVSFLVSQIQSSDIDRRFFPHLPQGQFCRILEKKKKKFINRINNVTYRNKDEEKQDREIAQFSLDPRHNFKKCRLPAAPHFYLAAEPSFRAALSSISDASLRMLHHRKKRSVIVGTRIHVGLDRPGFETDNRETRNVKRGNHGSRGRSPCFPCCPGATSGK